MGIELKAELIILPYDNLGGNNVLKTLLDELKSGRWQRFQAAVAFAKTSGNDESLLSALSDFLDAGGSVSLTFGADVFSATARGSDFDAVEQLISTLGDSPEFTLNVYHEPGRTFHPKLYLFSNPEAGAAKGIIGSSNWSQGGLMNNVEANVAFELDLDLDDHREAFETLQGLFRDYWTEQG